MELRPALVGQERFEILDHGLQTIFLRSIYRNNQRILKVNLDQGPAEIRTKILPQEFPENSDKFL